MRLASLARKIKVTPSKITDFVEEQGIVLTRGSNTKLTDDQVMSILKAFDAELPEEEPKEEVIEEKTNEEPSEIVIDSDEEVIDHNNEKAIESAQKATIKNKPEPASPIDDILSVDGELEDPLPRPQEAKAAEEETLADDAQPNEDNEKDQDDVEVIKAPKVQLQGLTVKGKIDLPEPKPKEPKTKEEEKEKASEEKVGPDGIVYTRGPKKENRKKNKNVKNRDKRKQDPNYNPVEAERKRKAREEEKERQRRIKAQKEAKAKHYQQKIRKQQKADSNPVKSVTTSQEPKETPSVVPKKAKQKTSKNPISRFWKWMNT